MGTEPYAGNHRRGAPSSGWLPGLLALLVAFGAAGCGNKEAPKPPPSLIPLPTTDLTLQQRGDELMLRMTYPAMTLGGLVLEEFEAIEVWELTRIVPAFLLEEGTAPAEEEDTGNAGGADREVEGDSEQSQPEAPEGLEPADEAGDDGDPTGAESPTATEEESAEEGQPTPRSLMFQFPSTEDEEEAEQSKEALVFADPASFAADAEMRLSLAGTELESAVTGDKIVIRLPIGEAPTEEEIAYIFAVKTVASRKLTSSFSNMVKIVPREPPSGPTSIAVVGRERGVELNWETESPGKGFHVYRRLAQERGYGAPIYTAVPEVFTFLDAGASYGNRYIYTVTSLASRVPVVESAISAEFEIDYEDRFAPTPPSNPVVLPEPGQVRLLWEPSRADDLSGYLVLRGLPGEEPAAVHLEPVTGLEYVDIDVVSGREYLYQVVAVDQNGNRSAPTEEVQVRVP